MGTGEGNPMKGMWMALGLAYVGFTAGSISFGVGGTVGMLVGAVFVSITLFTFLLVWIFGD